MPEISQECRAEVAERQADALSKQTAEQAKMSTLSKLFATSDPNAKAFAELRVAAGNGDSACKDTEIVSKAVFTKVANEERGKGGRS